MGFKNCWKYFKLYASQIFDIGNSTGSLLLEIITLFRTFQRISAPSEFITKFNPECVKMFSWVIDLIEIISNSVHTTPLLNFELFSIYICFCFSINNINIYINNSIWI